MNFFNVSSRLNNIALNTCTGKKLLDMTTAKNLSLSKYVGHTTKIDS